MSSNNGILQLLAQIQQAAATQDVNKNQASTHLPANAQLLNQLTSLAANANASQDVLSKNVNSNPALNVNNMKPSPVLHLPANAQLLNQLTSLAANANASQDVLYKNVNSNPALTVNNMKPSPVLHSHYTNSGLTDHQQLLITLLNLLRTMNRRALIEALEGNGQQQGIPPHVIQVCII